MTAVITVLALIDMLQYIRLIRKFQCILRKLPFSVFPCLFFTLTPSQWSNMDTGKDASYVVQSPEGRRQESTHYTAQLARRGVR